MKPRKTFRILGTIFLLIGVLSIGIGIAIQFYNNRFFENAKETEAYIETITTSERTRYSHLSKKHQKTTTHTVIISYEIDGEFYENVSLNYYSNDMHEGDTITIYYNPDNPYEIIANGSQYFPIIFSSILGFIFALVGSILLIIHFRFQRKKNLITTGTCIKLPIAKIGVNYNVRVNGHPGYYVVCEKEAGSSASQEFYKSDNYFDPEFDLRYHIGDFVPIYIDPTNPDKYFMDVEHIETNSNLQENCSSSLDQM